MEFTQFPDRGPTAWGGEEEAAAQSFLVRTFGWMFVGLGLSAAVAAIFAANADTAIWFEDHLVAYLALIVADFVLVGVIGLGVRRLSAQTATLLYCLFAGVNGVLFSVVFSLYTAAEIAPAFAAAAATFAVAAAYGYLTKRDLGSLSSLLVMAFGGLLIGTLINVFVASSGLYWLTTIAAVGLFTGLTAWTVQALKRMGIDRSGEEAENMAIFGALLLSLEFLNLFLQVLRLFQGTGGPGGPGAG